MTYYIIQYNTVTYRKLTRLPYPDLYRETPQISMEMEEGGRVYTQDTEEEEEKET